MKKNSIYSIILSAGFIVVSMTTYNVAKFDYSDPQLLTQLIEIPEANADTNNTVVKEKPKRIDKLLKQCLVCHTFTQNGKNKTGPNLFNTYGKQIAENKTFKYSKAFKNTDLVWNDENLDGYFKKPSKFIPKNKMAFAGIKKEEDRKLVINYLKNLQN